MPKIAFKLMWDRIQKGENFMAVVKNLAKSGKHYWVVTEFEAKRDKLSNEIVSYTAFRKAAPLKAVEAITPIYKKLIEIEKQGGMDASEKYLRGFFEEKGITYDEFVDELVGNKGIFKMFFTAMKKLFG
jgi:DNA polymerase III gamma/tau subunit